MTDETLLKVINTYGFTVAQITKSKGEISNFCQFVTAKTKQACFHKDVEAQLYRLRKEGLVT